MNNYNISEKDKSIIRELAKKQMEIATTPYMKKLKQKWIDLNSKRESDPLVTIEGLSFYDELILPLMKCEGSLARSFESDLLIGMVNNEVFGDDKVVKDYFPVVTYHSFLPFGVEVKKEHTKGLGHHFKEQIKDLEEDFHLLGDSVFSDNLAAAKERAEIAGNLFGDILPPKITSASIASCLTQNLVHIMSMETLFYSMYDYPELFKKMMEKLSDDYLSLFSYLENGGFIYPTTDGEMLCNGSFSYNDFMPSKKPEGENFLISDIWGFMDSQETVGVSPEMFDEFIFPYYLKIGEKFNSLSYGCCEPVDPVWEKSLSRFPNLRKISVSPWCNEEYMGEKLKGTGIIYFRKPSPNHIGVGTVLDEDEVRKSIRKTVKASRGCKLEISQRDVYTVNSDMGKVRRYVEIIRQEIEKHSY